MIGPPGSGKGTQAQRLANRFRIEHISSGELFRQAAGQGSALGKAAERYMKKGLLVPDKLAAGMVLERLQGLASKEGFVLDGFPRNLSQVHALHAALDALDKQIQHVFVLELPEKDVLLRITGRRLDPETGNIYHLKFNPPPAEISDRLIQRTDDSEATVRRRLQDYHTETLPMISFYAKMGIVHCISALGSPDEVDNRLRAYLE
ncbi:MAG: adenylate kinase family protein [bacterium]